MCIIFLFLFLSLSLLPTTTTTTTVGVTYSTPPPSSPSPPPPPPPPDCISTAMTTLNLHSLRLDDPDPSIIRTFLYTNTTLFLTLPNYMVSPIATNRTIALAWLYSHVVPFYPRVNITTISVGNAFLDSYPEHFSDLLPAITNLHLSLRNDLGIRHIQISTTFSFVSAISSPFPPSSAVFQEPPGTTTTFFGSLLQFLQETNSSFLINIYPYNLYRLRPEIPLGLALFQDHAFNFRDDLLTGVRYRNLFDMMVDAVVSAMAVEGYETIPIVVAETGWPSGSANGNEVDANPGYAEIYLEGLVKHLASGTGTPLLKDGIRQVYVYEMFDKEAKEGRDWGLLYPNGTMKYDIDFSGTSSFRGVSATLSLLLVMWLCQLELIG
ncbi:unnamed protein product [Lupinus luteus]|uniref:glucan endo-1,3-beta-D-glucosidase n=1 Tax=Lupinus luteus TaxID=3873 RepID=A0AAV1X9Q2_LUPLU